MLGNDIQLSEHHGRLSKGSVHVEKHRFGHGAPDVSHMLVNDFQLPTTTNSFSNHKLATSDSFPISVHKPCFPVSNGTNSNFPFS